MKNIGMNHMVAPHGVEIKRWRSKKRFRDANWLVRVRTGSPQTMRDGSHWDGWENVGHYRTLAEARAAASEVE